MLSIGITSREMKSPINDNTDGRQKTRLILPRAKTIYPPYKSPGMCNFAKIVIKAIALFVAALALSFLFFLFASNYENREMKHAMLLVFLSLS